MRVISDAMTSPLGQVKSFHEGCLIINPEKTANHGDYVVVLVPRTKEITFKQYVIDGSVSYLKPLNPQYPITQIDKRTKIVGVAISSIKLFE